MPEATDFEKIGLKEMWSEPTAVVATRMIQKMCVHECYQRKKNRKKNEKVKYLEQGNVVTDIWGGEYATTARSLGRSYSSTIQ